MLADKPHRPINVGFVRELSVDYYLPAFVQEVQVHIAVRLNSCAHSEGTQWCLPVLGDRSSLS